MTISELVAHPFLCKALHEWWGAFSLYFLDPFSLLLALNLTCGDIHWEHTWRLKMNDLLYILLTVLFFELTCGFIRVCERLMDDKS